MQSQLFNEDLIKIGNQPTMNGGDFSHVPQLDLYGRLNTSSAHTPAQNLNTSG